MFTLKAGEKKFLAIATIVGLLFVVVVGTAVALLTAGDHEDELPYLQATTGERLIRVEPTIFCKIDLTGCRQGAKGEFAPRIPVPPGEKLTVSLSRGLFDAPWSLTVEYLTPTGFQVEQTKSFSPDERYALTFTSTRDRIVSNIEIKLPGPFAADGKPTTRGFWSINTLPPDTKVPEQVAISNFTGSSNSTDSVPAANEDLEVHQGPATRLPDPPSPPTLVTSGAPIRSPN